MRSTLLAAALIGTALQPVMAAPQHKDIYHFTGGSDGGFPHSGLIAGSTGVLYGTTSSGGTGHNGVVFSLTPPASHKHGWAQSTLYAFTGGSDGGIPYDNLYQDAGGALYGTTYAGGDANGDGVVYKLTPPAAGQTAWTESVIHTFTNGNDGAEPWTVLIADAKGNLYGTTTSGGSGVVGTVFELSPPKAGKTAWKETILYNFTGNNDGGEPFGGLVMGSDGSLFGTTGGYGAGNYGTVYQLTPPVGGKGAWGFNLLHAFTGGSDGEVPRAGMIAGPGGVLYGTTAGFDNSQGTVFRMNPPSGGGGWTEDVLYNFNGMGFDGNGPWQAVSMDASGALYGTTLGVGKTAFGEVFKLTPSRSGGLPWKHTALRTFKGGMDSQFPYSNVLIGGDGTLYGTTEGSAGQSGFFPGTVWEILP